MSKVNFSRNVFLEKEELVRFQDFLQNDSKAFLFKNDVFSYGIVAQPSLLGLDFLVQAGTTSGTFKITNNGYAVGDDLLLMSLTAFDNYPVTNNSLWYWVKISHRYLNTEVGTVSINTAGQVSGVGTLFTEVLRSQTSKAPIKIKFYKESVLGVPQTVVNAEVYEVVDIVSDTNITLSGTFTAETGLSYIVVGAVSLGAAITTTQKEGLYSYDNCAVSLVLESTIDTPPTAGYTTNKDFYVARLRNVGGTLTIQDKREDYFATSVAVTDINLKEKINFGDASVCKALLTADFPAILTGCTGSVISGSFELTAGSIYYNGEVFEVLAQSVADIGETGIYYFELDMSSLTLPVRRLSLNVGTSVPSGGIQYAYYSYSVLVFDLENLSDYLMRTTNNGSDIVNTATFRTNLSVYSKAETYTQTEQGNLLTKMVNIGNWDMETTLLKQVAHGLTASKIRFVSASILDDLGIGGSSFLSQTFDGKMGGGIYWDTTNISLMRTVSGMFDNANYNNAAFARGYIEIKYIA
jgi:hypothetical protein